MPFCFPANCAWKSDGKQEGGREGGKERGKNVTKQSCGLEEGGPSVEKKRELAKGSSTSSSQSPFSFASSEWVHRSLSFFSPSPYLSPSPLLVSLSANASSDFLLSRHDTVGEFRGQFFVPSPSRGGGPGGGGTVRRGSDLAIDY